MRTSKRPSLLVALAFSIFAVTLAAHLLPGALAAPRAQAASELPPVSMTCPMHPEVVEHNPGSCPICRMKLEPVRLDQAWACPIHPAVTDGESGTCRLCGRALGQVTVALTWTCPGESTDEHLERGTCAGGARMVLKRTVRPHGDHNPRHGGQFFMAPDNWHHLEGTYPREDLFRLYLYDDFSQPLGYDRMSRVRGRVVTDETYDPATRATIEHTTWPLRLAANGAYFEARLDEVPMPAAVTAKVRFRPDGPEHRFDFTFHTLSTAPARVEPMPQPADASATVPPEEPQPAAAAATEASGVSPEPPVGVAPSPVPLVSAGSAALEPLSLPPDPRSLVPLPIPDTREEILEHLRTRRQQIADLIAVGNLAAVFVPAFQAKDLAIALESRLDDLAPAQAAIAEPAIERLVRTAWLLDAFGDTGNRERLVEAFAVFTSTVSDLLAAFDGL